VALVRNIANGLRALFRREQVDGELDEELRSYVEMAIEEKVQQGMSRKEAARAVRLERGSLDGAKETVRDAGWESFLETCWQDLRFAGRVLRKSPGFTLSAILTLALGIGANTVVFSVVNALLLRPLPVERPSELTFLENEHYGPSQSYPDYKEIRDRNRTFAGLAGYRIAPMDLGTNAGADRVWGYLATGNYFDVLGVKPALGRVFHQNDDQQPGASPYVVLSYGTWQSRFGSDPAIVGKTIRINRQPYSVLGVAPRDFHGTEFFYWPELWVPVMMQAQIEGGNSWIDDRNTWNMFVIGRRTPRVSAAQAEADLNSIAAELVREYPAENEGLRFRLAKPGLIGNWLGGPARTFALGVLALASLVLLAACTNLASMLAARATERHRELAIRLAIGAGRGRVVRQVLIETLVLSLIGGGSGYVLATVLSQSLSRWRVPMDFPVQLDINPDWRVFLFALIASIVASALFGSAPAWRASRTDPNAVLKGGPSNWGVAHLSFRDILVVVQVSLCFVLVAACLLSLRGLQQAFKLNLGFEPQHVSVVGFDLGLPGYSEERGRAFQQQALETIRQLAGVESASYSNSVPLSIDQSQTRVFPADKADLRPSDRVDVTRYQVSPGFFQTLGTKLLAGRDFTWHDDDEAPPVAIVNVAFAKQVLHGENPVGKRFLDGIDGRLVEVIGVVEDGKYESLTESQMPAVFWPIRQFYNGTTTLEVRSALPAPEMADEMRAVISGLDSELPISGAGSLEQRLGLAFFPGRAAAVALSAFGVLAIILAGTGIQGLVAYAVARRTHEIGIRMALGARPVQVLRLVLGKMAMLLGVGSAVGLVLAMAMGRVIASVVYGVPTRDPLVMLVVIAAVAVLGVLASWSPARRATRVDPLVALRHE
jgi:predicted permease